MQVDKMLSDLRTERENVEQAIRVLQLNRPKTR